jgi:hypothetical protein
LLLLREARRDFHVALFGPRPSSDNSGTFSVL